MHVYAYENSLFLIIFLVLIINIIHIRVFLQITLK